MTQIWPFAVCFRLLNSSHSFMSMTEVIRGVELVQRTIRIPENVGESSQQCGEAACASVSLDR